MGQCADRVAHISRLTTERFGFADIHLQAHSTEQVGCLLDNNRITTGKPAVIRIEQTPQVVREDCAKAACHCIHHHIEDDRRQQAPLSDSSFGANGWTINPPCLGTS
jgi:hypothetical protein